MRHRTTGSNSHSRAVGIRGERPKGWRRGRAPKPIRVKFAGGTISIGGKDLECRSGMVEIVPVYERGKLVVKMPVFGATWSGTITFEPGELDGFF